ncbi:hypothetical protein [Sphingomonas abietis]|uniref:Uncharacterized protein n=1 Tax=Sphingomonas abietis TaxID=3012344 RepID=A0ABY7NQ78_9SPHN|nr:hypothetical protein [Sphingomonas abietis]WBO23696.1 hypothetical protein PBT88_06130 [Sphingomonas abietis]
MERNIAAAMADDPMSRTPLPASIRAAHACLAAHIVWSRSTFGLAECRMIVSFQHPASAGRSAPSFAGILKQVQDDDRFGRGSWPDPANVVSNSAEDGSSAVVAANETICRRECRRLRLGPAGSE